MAQVRYIPRPVHFGVCGFLFWLLGSALGAQDPVPAQLTLRESLRIDGRLENLVSFATIAIGPSDEILFSQRDDGQLLLYSATGQRIGTVGKRGAGPGEFRNTGSFGWVGDTIWVVDTGSERLSLFSRTGRFIRQERARDIRASNPESVRGTMSSPLTQSYLPNGNGTLAILALGRPPKGECPCFAWLSETGQIKALVATDPPETQEQLVAPGGRRWSPPIRWEAWTDVSPDGALVGLLFATGEDSRRGLFRLVVIRQSGDTVFNRTYPFVGQRIPKASTERALATVPTNVRNDLASRMPEFYTPFLWPRFGRDGSIWVGLRPTESGNPWTVLDASGTPRGRIILPRNVRLAEAEMTKVWTIEEDADGLRSIVVYTVLGSK